MMMTWIYRGIALLFLIFTAIDMYKDCLLYTSHGEIGGHDDAARRQVRKFREDQAEDNPQKQDVIHR